MFTFNPFTLLSRLMFSRWTHSHEEQSNAWEETVSARLGPFHLESNDAFVLDHSDAYLGICLPLPRHENGRWQRHILQVGYRACRGEEQVRQAGIEMCWKRPFLGLTAMRSK
ncbi:MAG: hypothetical protein H6656_00075 [Ardenticatenaceae bacterium]|nr:hypothetical protein [Ardenticatenaceae bacterium]